jgi:hypothetical protein
MGPKRKTRRGRPPKGDFHNKSAVFSTRITPETRAAIEAAAEASGRSISQEVERRLRESFTSARSCTGLEKMSDDVQGLVVLLAMVITRMEQASGRSWRTNVAVGLAAIAALTTFLKQLREGGHLIASLEEAQSVAEKYAAAVNATDPQRYGIFEACGLICLLQSAKFQDSNLHPDVAPLAWVRDKLGLSLQQPAWRELVEQAQKKLAEEEGGQTQEQAKQDEEKKS